ncbi:DEAD/DEAH box helicase family protein [Bradyrhizobium sp. 83012]|uniref:DEAD/DEAH box helicase family protein n=1 Tax=Bradyrhizobium aeschynomenes TaxID=2734909 RepID=A0ABX2C9J1_9BRAD|nr:DEAD/DEAH box helicase family protein [Bradyrhizobium aeschynomenes]NPU64718.1 DEAD/DEAH box helicase family protein [Bradyrhizobium aeschynomenes]
MPLLSELNLRTSYHKGRDDIANDFYLPCMRRATEYDRAVGYFRSTVFLIAWPALRKFIEQGGRIRILCSQVLAEQDIAALEAGYSARVDEILNARLLEEVKSLLREETILVPAKILAALVAQGSIDLQIAVLRDTQVRGASGRIFHDKLGIFRDATSNIVIFKGSMNETWAGLSADGNLESIDVAASWMGARDLERARTEEAYFTDLWNDNYPTLRVRPFPQIAREELASQASVEWEADLEAILSANETGQARATERSLHPHQAAGLASWAANGRKGILAFVTGSGKTFTAITALKDSLKNRNKIAVVVAPDQVLFDQWYRELEVASSELGGGILRAGAGHTRWRESLRLWTSPGPRKRILLATVQTASSDEFRAGLTGGDHLLLIADEVHRLGSPHHRKLLDESLFGERLGLSATPERAGDPIGTSALLGYFRGILEPRYTLADAVRDGVLTRYFYRPHTVTLSDLEAAEWLKLTKEIGRLRARIGNREDVQMLKKRLQQLFIQRAKIVKHATAKVPLAVSVLSSEYKPGQRWIVYCDDMSQLSAVATALDARGMSTIPFHSQMEGDRAETLGWLDRRGGIVIAIKCLDEGVDVPSVTHALILASSKNPREFIQRRGRVLRTAPGKSLAYVHDALVLPPSGGEARSESKNDPIIKGELARAVEFANNADNPACAADLQRIAIELGIDWRSLLLQGNEDEEDD